MPAEPKPGRVMPWKVGKSRMSFAVLALTVATALPAVAGAGTDPRIVGGQEVNPPGAYPFIAALVLPGGDAYAGLFCGGSLIAPEWVLTAAHCVAGDSPARVDVVVGRHDLRAADGERVGVEAIFVHPDYEARPPTNDAALLRLSRPVGYATAALPPDGAWETPGRWLTVAGWGDTKSQPRYPYALREVQVPLVEDARCRQAYEVDFSAASMLCAGDLETGGIDSCFGDSGGPLFAPGPRGFTLVGIVSWGEGCALAGYPGVYTRVSAVREWVTTVTGVSPGRPMVRCAGVEATIVGTAGDDDIRGTAGDDVIAALGGADRVWAGPGDDLVCGGGGDDFLSGGLGADHLYGGPGSDVITGGGGPDRLFGGGGDDLLIGDRGRDIARGGLGSNTCEAEHRFACLP